MGKDELVAQNGLVSPCLFGNDIGNGLIDNGVRYRKDRTGSESEVALGNVDLGTSRWLVLTVGNAFGDAFQVLISAQSERLSV